MTRYRFTKWAEILLQGDFDVEFPDPDDIKTLVVKMKGIDITKLLDDEDKEVFANAYDKLDKEGYFVEEPI